MSKHNLSVLAGLLIGLVLLLPLCAAFGDDAGATGKGREEKEKGKEKDAEADSGKKAEDATPGPTTNVDDPRYDGTPKSDNPSVRSGVRKRWGYKQKLEAAIQQRQEEKERRRQEWLTDEERRREAIRKVREELAAKRQKMIDEAKNDPATQAAVPPPLPPADQLTTIELENGNTFQGAILGETDEEITLQIEGGELTIAKSLITKIRRPPQAVQPPKK